MVSSRRPLLEVYDPFANPLGLFPTPCGLLPLHVARAERRRRISCLPRSGRRRFSPAFDQTRGRPLCCAFPVRSSLFSHRERRVVVGFCRAPSVPPNRCGLDPRLRHQRRGTPRGVKADRWPIYWRAWVHCVLFFYLRRRCSSPFLHRTHPLFFLFCCMGTAVAS